MSPGADGPDGLAVFVFGLMHGKLPLSLSPGFLSLCVKPDPPTHPAPVVTLLLWVCVCGWCACVCSAKALFTISVPPKSGFCVILWKCHAFNAVRFLDNYRLITSVEFRPLCSIKGRCLFTGDSTAFHSPISSSVNSFSVEMNHEIAYPAKQRKTQELFTL